MVTSGSETGARAQRALILDRVSLGGLYALLIWAPLAFGAHEGWPLAVTELLALFAVSTWLLGMLLAQRLEWRCTSLDLPLGLLIAFVLVQLALSNRPLVSWALAVPKVTDAGPVDLPTPLVTLGTVSPAQTLRSLLLLLTYVAVYVLVVNLIRRHRQLDRLVQTLLFLGAVLALGGLLGYMAGGTPLMWQRERPVAGRVVGTFVNPDHFAAWLAMLVCLGLGYIAARQRTDGRFSPRELLWRPAREQLIRRYIPAVGLGVMALALIFTLSRGAVVSLLLALVVLLLVFGRLGLARRSLVFVGGLMLVTLAYAAWIGLEPFVTRLAGGDYISRVIQWGATVPMLTLSPVFGVGLGAYKDIFLRYQPAALGPGKVYYPAAHNDLLQVVVELGLVGGAIVLLAIWRTGSDLLFAHVLGVGTCPAGGARGESARRTHPYSIGIAVGALGGALALLVHSAVDFAARIPAVGILGAACVGIATVSLHTRFTPSGEKLLVPVRVFAFRSRALTGAVVVAACGAAVGLLLPIVRPALVTNKLSLLQTNNINQIKLDPGKLAPALARADEALAIDSSDPVALAVRGLLHLDAATAASYRGVAPNGTALSPEEQTREAMVHLERSIRDFETALTLTPSNPWLHERLGWAYGSLAAIEPSRESDALRQAVTHLQRAIALAPENPSLYRSLAALTPVKPQSLMKIGLEAARSAARRDPDLLPALVDRFLPLDLTETQWAAIVPDTGVDYLQLAAVLEARGLLEQARFIYRRAADFAPRGEQPFYRWMLGMLLIRLGDHEEAAAELSVALEDDPDNPELHLARARALAGLGDPEAPGAYRIAILKAEARSTRRGADAFPFDVQTARTRALGLARLDGAVHTTPMKYRSAFAHYLVDQRRWAEALPALDIVLAERPQDAAAHFSRGVVLDGLGARRDALEAYRRAVAMDGSHMRYRQRLAERLWEADQYYQAIDEWRTITTKEPANVGAHLNLARAYLHVGDRMAAFREYRDALRLAPEEPEARRGFTRLGGIL